MHFPSPFVWKRQKIINQFIKILISPFIIHMLFQHCWGQQYVWKHICTDSASSCIFLSGPGCTSITMHESLKETYFPSLHLGCSCALSANKTRPPHCHTRNTTVFHWTADALINDSPTALFCWSFGFSTREQENIRQKGRESHRGG